MRRKSIRRLIMIAFACLGFSACGFMDKPPEKKEDGGTNDFATPPIANKQAITPATELQCEGGTPLTYGNFGEAFMLTYCTQCHSQYLTQAAERAGAPVGLNFDTVDGVVSARARILLRAAAEKDNTMPPGIVVPDGERLRLQEWLRCGAPGEGDQIR